MMRSVVTVLHGHQETVSSNGPINETAQRFEQAVGTIEERDREYTEIATGITVAKKNAEAAMVE
ncbi:MAG: hypothetical protein JW863_03440 [Chitinispirillaceae bacterium]|nr:hypothetical protein [Chitinispirillaceae bacterium]